MNKRTKMIVAIVALVFMAVFTLFTVMSLYNSELLGGTVLYIGLASGVVAIGLYLLIMRDNRIKNQAEAQQIMEAEAARKSLQNGIISKASPEPAATQQSQQETELPKPHPEPSKNISINKKD